MLESGLLVNRFNTRVISVGLQTWYCNQVVTIKLADTLTFFDNYPNLCMLLNSRS